MNELLSQSSQQCPPTFLLTIEDDGIGYGRNIVHGKGLANMKVRARKIGGILSITSAKGTLVMLGLQLSGQAPEKKPHK